jgi:hypothetical protein
MILDLTDVPVTKFRYTLELGEYGSGHFHTVTASGQRDLRQRLAEEINEGVEWRELRVDRLLYDQSGEFLGERIMRVRDDAPEIIKGR